MPSRQATVRAEGFTIGQQDPVLKHGIQGQAHKKRAVRTGVGNNIWGAWTMYCGNLWERFELSRPRRRSVRR
ncbi:unnamed protein product [Sphagnum jensenii]|uniref:Uncharacterized protein n=1 Tax=Sphagnum jensenii TaxID=128206 RepID=A0ABP1B076_9BRYO